MPVIDVYCVNVGNKYGSQYVYKLKTAVEKYLKLPHNFWCITDKTELYPFSIQADDLPGYWNKISIFKYTGTCLYFDLDVIIHGNIDMLVSDRLMPYRLINPVWKNPSKAKFVKDRPDIGTSLNNSSVMSWSSETKIYEKFMKDPEYYIFKYDGDDRFLSHETTFKTFDTDIIYSYRDGAHYKNDNTNFKYRPDYSIALFHQKPEIHECSDHKIVKDNWI
tara:strand:- start:796 stop:1455 length:660 start_codon:yes stop_codon:yes gene_type:complete